MKTIRLLICTLTTSVFLSCSEELPTENDWTIAMSKLTERIENVIFQNRGVKFDTTTVDFFVTNNKWYIALIASVGDSMGAYQAYIGTLHKKQLFFEPIYPVKRLNENELENYRAIKESGNIYKLIGEKGFWRNETNLQKLWDCSIHRNFDGTFTITGAGFSSLRIDKP